MGDIDNTSAGKAAIVDLVAGSLGAVALVYVGQPFDTVKVKMQTFPIMYKNMVDCFLITFKKDGVAKGLYAGTIPALVANVAENAALFVGYGFCQKIIMKLNHKERINDLTTIENGTAGFFAAFGSSLTLCPTELIKCKLQAQREMWQQNPKIKRYGPFTLTKQIIQTEGMMGMFRGFVPTLIREMPGYFFFFAGYEASRELLRKEYETKDDIGPAKTMLAGAIGGSCFWLSTFPADVVKSRVQVSGLSTGFIACTTKILSEEGILALYNGLLPTLVRTIPATATLFVVFEYTKKFMNSIL